MRKIVAALAATTCLFSLGGAAWALAGQASSTAADSVSRETDRFLETTHLNPANPAEFTAACDSYLARAAQLRSGLERETGPATIETTFRAYDALRRVLGAAESDSGVVSQTSPSAETRDAARACSARVDAVSTEISLSQAIYARLHAISAAAADPDTRFLLNRTIAQYDRAGVGTDEATHSELPASEAKTLSRSIPTQTPRTFSENSTRAYTSACEA